ncbi:unnamed protein product [Nyctereutes procyonoides]|uniref:(raccoon dog) hypothetical protein n=1 Tax=Nyctereutes procyonoides TaxID=34880 RepID=A0A811ZDP4_NYCPR|nr:unnamed protein product [Nyctereutes procyonoides]
MATNCCQHFLELCEDLPVDENRAETFIAEHEACGQMYENLSFSSLSMEEYKLILCTDMWKTVQEKFAPRNPKEKQRTWARSLSHPCTKSWSFVPCYHK